MKKNQPILLADCEYLTETTQPDDVYREPFVKTRNRIESRTASVFSNPLLTDSSKWELVEAIIKVDRFKREYKTKKGEWKESHQYLRQNLNKKEQFVK